MNVKLISPAVTMRPMDSAWKTRMSPPLSLAVLAALTPGDHTIEIADENIEKLTTDDQPDLVGITVKVDTFNRSAEIAAGYRKRGVPVVFGGIHPTVCPEQCMAVCDAVVVGEAEELWLELLADVSKGDLKSIYRNRASVDIASAPIPAWELLKEKSYLFTNTMTIGRGCPWRCDFCYNSSLNVDARYRMKPLEKILAEIESLASNHIMFIDDNFIGDPDGARRLLRHLKEMEFTWHTAVSADIGRNEDLLDMMAESGCKSLFIGFESVSQKNLLSCHKGQNRIEQYDQTVRMIHQRGMMVNASLVFGFDGDDRDVFQATLDWLVRNSISSMTAHILTPYPGTRLYQKLEEEGRIIDRNLDHYNTANAVFRPMGMSAEELEAGYLWMYEQFYSWASILNRLPLERSQMLAYLQFNLLYRKYGKITSHLGKIFGMRPLAKFARKLAYPQRRIRERPLVNETKMVPG